MGKIVAPGLIGQKLVKNPFCAKNWCLTSVKFDLWSLRGRPEVKSETTSQIGRFTAHLMLLPLAICLSNWAPERLNWSPALLT